MTFLNQNCSMPLAEFLSISKGEMDSTHQRTSNDPFLRPETDFMELICENGQIMIQGQSRKGPISDNFHTFAPKVHDTRNPNASKTAKFSMVDSVPSDFQLPVPSCEMGLDHDVDDIVPWLNYPSIENSLPNEYNTSDFLRELSGVTMNDLSTTGNHLASREKRISFQGNGYSTLIGNSVSLKHGNTEKHISNLSDITRNNNGSLNQNCDFTSLRLQKLDAGQPSNVTSSSGFTNFPCISRHAVLARANLVNSRETNRSENDDQTLKDKDTVSRNYQSFQALMMNGTSESFPAKPAEEILSSKDKLSEDVAKNDAIQNPGKPEVDGQRNKESPVVVVAAPSVCSGNSVERASNEVKRDLKRKSRDTGDSEDPSEEVEEESVDVRKAPRAKAGLKRTRAAEVHNLSERRRRDRINEKMRSLQELIPNCNKVDKASMLDEAIEYLKTLQLQVQMLAMGGGLYMPPMMLPGIQGGGHMPHFSPMMGLGFNMIPFQGPRNYPIPNMGPAFPGMPGSVFQPFGHPGQGLPIHMQQPPVLAPSGVTIPAPPICSKNVAQMVPQAANSNSSANANASSETMPR